MGVKSKTIGIEKSEYGNGWKFDIRLKMPDGTYKRLRKSGFETKAKAIAAAGKLKAEALEGRYFDREHISLFTVEDAWEVFKPVAQEKHRSSQTTMGRVVHILRHLGKKQALSLTQKDIDNYRSKRRKEKTVRKGPPSNATLNREVALLRRILNYAVKCKELKLNPLSQVEMLVEDNVRDVEIPEADIKKLVEAAERPLSTFLLIARDSGMRKNSILRMRRSRIDVSRPRAIIKLSKGDTKTNKAQTVVLTQRATDALKELLNSHDSEWVFMNPNTSKPYINIRKMYKRAIKKAGLEDKGYWIHDQRRVFSTEARRAGVDESTIMSLTGHRTRSAFERYNIVTTSDQEEAVKKIEAVSTNNVIDLDSEKTLRVLKRENMTLRHKNNILHDENIQLKRTLKLFLDQAEIESGLERRRSLAVRQPCQSA